MDYKLRKWNENEYVDFYHASNDAELYQNMTEGFPKTLEECRQIVASFSKSNDETECVRAICINNKPVGCIGVFFDKAEYGKNCEIAYWLYKDYRGQGVMERVGREFIDMVFKRYDVHRIYATPLEKNKSSIRLLEKCGFVCEGVLHDYVWKQGQFLNSALYANVKKGQIS